MQTGSTHPWNEEARARLREKTGAQSDQLKQGTPAAKKSPIAGPFETHKAAKVWIVVSPDGTCYHVRNLRNFCREHPSLFLPDSWETGYAGLLAVQQARRKNKVTLWKGWTLGAAAVKEDIDPIQCQCLDLLYDGMNLEEWYQAVKVHIDISKIALKHYSELFVERGLITQAGYHLTYRKVSP